MRASTYKKRYRWTREQKDIIPRNFVDIGIMASEANASRIRSDDVEQRYELITRRLPVVLDGDMIKQLLIEGKSPKGFWATAPTGIPHLAYFVPLLKLAEFVKADVDTTVLVCDIYAYLVNYNAPFPVVADRARYYRFIITAMLESLGIKEGQVRFVNASEYELTPSVVMDTFRLACLARQDEARSTGAEYQKSDRLSLLWCPSLPGLAEEYLDADFQFGGEDQTGLFEFNARFLPMLGYRRRAHLMNAMVPGLQGSKMSSSVPDSKIGLLDSPDDVRAKIAIASCQDSCVEGNGILSVLRHIIFPILEFRAEYGHPNHNETSEDDFLFIVPASMDGEPPARFTSYISLEKAFVSGIIQSQSLRKAVADAVNELLSPIHEAFSRNDYWQTLHRRVYLQQEDVDLRQEAENRE